MSPDVASHPLGENHSKVWSCGVGILCKDCYCFCSVTKSRQTWLFATPRTAACQAPLSPTVFQSLLRFMSTELVIPSNHVILCLPLLLLSSIFPSIRVFSSELTLGRPRGWWLHVPSYKWGLYQTWEVSGFCSLGSSLRCSLTPWGNHTSQGSGISLIYNPPVTRCYHFYPDVNKWVSLLLSKLS